MTVELRVIFVMLAPLFLYLGTARVIAAQLATIPVLGRGAETFWTETVTAGALYLVAVVFVVLAAHPVASAKRD